MTEKQAQELKDLRDLQQGLRWRMDSLDARIRQLESSIEAAPGEPQPPQPVSVSEEIITPPPLPFQAIKPDPAPLANVVEPPVATPDPEPQIPPPMEAPQPPPAAPAESFELHLGRVWLVRLGVVILLTGLVFLGNFAWQEFISRVGPFGKLLMIFLAGGALGAAGWFVKRNREELKTYGNVLIGGGIATIYYATYASHFVEPLRVISNPLLGGVLLLVAAALILWLADRMRSQAVAAATTILGFYTAAINPIAGFSLFSNILLGVIAVTLLVRRRWISVSFLSLVGCYLAFAFWRFYATGSLGILPESQPGAFWNSLLFPACYWTVFTVAVFLGRSQVLHGITRSTFLTVNNGAFFALTAPLVAGTYPGQFWLYTLAYGAILLGLAIFAAKLASEDKAFDGTYLTQGLTLLFLGIVFKASGYQVAILFALQSGTLLALSRMRHGRILQLFSGAAATIAAAFACGDVFRNQPHAPLTAITVSLFLIAAAWMFKRQRSLFQPLSFQWRAAGYVALAIGTILVTVFHVTEGDARLFTLLVLGIALTSSLHILRMPELTSGGQLAPALAVILWFARPNGEFSALSPFLGTVACLLLLMHWWQFQKALQLEKPLRILCEATYAAAIVAIFFAWTASHFFPAHYPLAFAASALVLLSYGLLVRALPLAVASQAFSVATAPLLFDAFLKHEPWTVTLASLALFAAQSFVAGSRLRRLPPRLAGFTHIYCIAIRATSVILGLLAIRCGIPIQLLFVAYSALSFAFFLRFLAWPNPEFLFYAGAALTCGIIEFLLGAFGGSPIFGQDLIGFALILVAQQIGKHRDSAAALFTPIIQGSLIVAGLCGTWILTGRWVATVQSGFLLTISWSLLAFLVLAFGFILKERVYRISGLVILGASISRIFLIDVWQLETIYRILSFIILGLVLLILGFLYNRFSSTLRKWL